MSYYVALDVGGSKVLGALFDAKGKIIATKKVKTFAARGTDFVYQQIKLVIDTLLEGRKKVKGIGVIVPGIVLNHDYVEFCPNVPFDHFPLGMLLREEYAMPVALGNDVSLAVYGEWKSYDRPVDHAVGLFVGTGVGGGLILDRKLYTGQGGGGELGHMVLVAHGAGCGCGNEGCLEAYAGKAGLLRRLKAAQTRGRESLLYDYLKSDGSMITSEAFRTCYEAGDELALELIDQASYYLGLAVANFINMLHPELFIFGGGIMESLHPVMLPRIKQVAKNNAMPALGTNLEFSMSRLGDNAGIVGSFYQIYEMVNHA
ncbi:MAG TPA: ROK family protein [Tissierellia bacterium]|nr:ROK family protein [Tissierellia bacterium]